MIPSVIESQLERGIKDFLRTTFPPSTPFFEGILERLFEEYRSQLNSRNLRSYVLYFATASTNPTNTSSPLPTGEGGTAHKH